MKKTIFILFALVTTAAHATKFTINYHCDQVGDGENVDTFQIKEVVETNSHMGHTTTYRLITKSNNGVKTVYPLQLINENENQKKFSASGKKNLTVTINSDTDLAEISLGKKLKAECKRDD